MRSVECERTFQKLLEHRKDEQAAATQVNAIEIKSLERKFKKRWLMFAFPSMLKD